MGKMRWRWRNKVEVRKRIRCRWRWENESGGARWKKVWRCNSEGGRKKM